jgi:molybdate transport system substrate-binding protein
MTTRHLPWIALSLSLAALVILAIVWSGSKTDESLPTPAGETRPAVLVHAAPALRSPLEAARAEFERDYGVKFEINYQPSEHLLTTLKLTKQGDLFLPADDSYVKDARKDGLVDQDYPIATLNAVAVFRPNFPKDPKDINWDDVLQKGFQLAQPNTGSAIGKLTKDGLTPSGYWHKIEQTNPTMMGSVTEAANAVNLGSADAAIIWDAVAKQYPKLKVVKLPELDKITANVTAAVCKNANARTVARWFAEYLEGEGQKHFEQAGYSKARVAAKPKAIGDQGPKK